MDPHPRRPRHQRTGAPLRPWRAQYVAVRYTQRLAEAGAVASVGSNGDCARAEAFNSLFKAQPIRNKGPWKNLDDLEVAVAEYVDWFNHRRLPGESGLVPPAEYEKLHRSTTLPEQRAPRDFHASIKPGTRQPVPSDDAREQSRRRRGATRAGYRQ